MFKRYWIVAVTFSLALAGSGIAQQQDAEPDERAASENDQTDELPFTLPVIIIEDQEASEARQREEAERTQREKDDLVAQQGMNAATQAMNEATQSMRLSSWVSTGLVGLGTFLLVITLLLTLQANRAALAAVRINRAWLTFSPGHEGPIQNGIVRGQVVANGYSFAPKYINTGKSPAINVRLTSDYRIVDDTNSIPEFSPDQNESDKNPSHVAVGDTIATMIALDGKETSDIFNNGKTLFIYFKVIYQDGISEEDRISESCFRVVNLHGSIVIEGRAKSATQLVPVGPQNNFT